MKFTIKDGPLPIGGKGLLMNLTRKQADRRRHILQRVMEDGSRVSVLPKLMRPAPELPELGTYALAGACEFKSGETIAFPAGMDLVAALGKEVMGKLDPEDDEALASSVKAVTKPEKKPKPAHGGPVAFGPTVVGAGAAAAKAAQDPAPPPETKKSDPAAAHSISKTGKK